LRRHPAQGYGTLLESILPFPALDIFQHLTGRGLADIEESLPLQMAGSYLLRCFHTQKLLDSNFPNAIEAKIRITSPWRSATRVTGTAGCTHPLEGTTKMAEQAFIQAAIPCPKKRQRPKPLLLSPPRTSRRKSSYAASRVAPAP
jgi:hypothetical protein